MILLMVSPIRVPHPPPTCGNRLQDIFTEGNAADIVVIHGTGTHCATLSYLDGKNRPVSKNERGAMAVSVLKTKNQVLSSRAEMKRRGIDCVSSFAERALRKFGLLRGVNIGDRVKSWDVLRTVWFLEEHVPKDVPVLDLGASGCEILPILHRLGYSNLAGIDLDPGIVNMPHAEAIRYLAADFMNVPREDGSFGCVTAISVIEHGFDAERLLTEMARILRPGGFLVASVDYWPEKIDTTGIAAYGMDWIIFSREDLQSFLGQAEGFGLQPVGALDFDAGEKVANWMGRSYTFAWIALCKAP
jgi:SAM-dependent methyltransferase